MHSGLIWLVLGTAVGCTANNGAVSDGGLPGKNNTGRQSVTCLGQVVPGERVIRVNLPERALVAELKVRRGADVTRGFVLAVLRDYEVARTNFARAERNVELARSKIEQVKAGERAEAVAAQEAVVKARQAEADYMAARKKRYQELYASRLISGDEYDEQVQQLTTAEAVLRREENLLDGYRTGRQEDVAIAERSLAVASSERDQAAASLEIQLVRAPQAGKVLEIHTYAGEQVGAEGLLDLADTSHIMIRAEVYETDIARVHLGDRTAIKTMMADQWFDGRVVEIDQQVSAGRILPTDAVDFTDRRVIVVHIRPDDSTALARLSNAQVTVRISTP